MSVFGSVFGSDDGLNHYKGWFVDGTALASAYPIAGAGDYSTVGSGGTGPTIYAWDSTSGAWEDTASSGLVSSVNGETGVIKTTDRLPFPIDGQAFVLTTGLKTPCRVVPFDCTITGWNLSIGGAAAADTMTVDVQVAATGGTPASICGAGTKPNISSAKSASSTTLTNWTVALTKGQDIYMNITVAPAAATWVNVTLYVRRA